MRQLICNSGGAILARLPKPVCDANAILVRVHFSMVSLGTELAPLRSVESEDGRDENPKAALLAKTKLAGVYLKAAVNNPRKAIHRAMMIARTTRVSHEQASAADATKLASSEMYHVGWNLGYSVAGEVVAVGKNVKDLSIGDRVACAGAGIANHADYVAVPRLLASLVPNEVTYREAATATIGAIALQGVRRASPELGEIVCVIGLGLIGQLTMQMLRAAGCKVIGTDLNQDRVDRAMMLGMDAGSTSTTEVAKIIRGLTSGKGVDKTLITAASKSHSLINASMQYTRAKGKVVIVGDIGLHVERSDFYRKEIDLLMSTSYGPGRYDSDYEIEGHDYPYSYVRWTLNRNLTSYLNLIGAKRIKVSPLIDREESINAAPALYKELASSSELPIGVLISYVEHDIEEHAPIRLKGGHLEANGKIGYALVGAGAFGISMLVPELEKYANTFDFRAIVSRHGLQGSNFAREKSVGLLASDVDEICQLEEIDLAVIASRHALHADQVIAFLSAGKHVFVEKPLATNWEQLSSVVDVYESIAEKPLLIVGYNRRFSPAVKILQAELFGRLSPMIMNYHMNAGYVPPDHWLQGAEGGGRNIGEACHIYDLFSSIAGSPALEISAICVTPQSGDWQRNDNFSATIKYENGVIGNLIYTALGPKQGMAKERLEVFCDGQAWLLDDYKCLTRLGDGEVLWESAAADKGHAKEIELLVDAIFTGSEIIPFKELIETSATALHVEDLLFGRYNDE